MRASSCLHLQQCYSGYLITNSLPIRELLSLDHEASSLPEFLSNVSFFLSSMHAQSYQRTTFLKPSAHPRQVKVPYHRFPPPPHVVTVHSRVESQTQPAPIRPNVQPKDQSSGSEQILSLEGDIRSSGSRIGDPSPLNGWGRRIKCLRPA